MIRRVRIAVGALPCPWLSCPGKIAGILTIGLRLIAIALPVVAIAMTIVRTLIGSMRIPIGVLPCPTLALAV